jgi:hypothetical protein
MPHGAVSRPSWTLVHLKEHWLLLSRVCSAVGVPMVEEAGGVLLGLVVIILACVSILAALHVW